MATPPPPPSDRARARRIAHDFNNLLTVMGGYAALLAGRRDDEHVRRAGSEILRAVETATALTAELRELGSEPDAR